MAGIVTDTHSLVWYLLGSPRISKTALERMRATIAGGDPVIVPSISLVEVVYLVEKDRLP